MSKKIMSKIIHYAKFLTKTAAHREAMPMRELYTLMSIPGMLNLANGK